MKKLEDVELAGRVAAWLVSHGVKSTSTVYRDGAYHVYYTLQLDIKPQPPVRIKDGSIIFPPGSQQAVVNIFLTSLMK